MGFKSVFSQERDPVCIAQVVADIPAAVRFPCHSLRRTGQETVLIEFHENLVFRSGFHHCPIHYDVSWNVAMKDKSRLPASASK
jgi:hypothetical protein